MRYATFEADNSSDLDKLVNEAMEKGAIPQGGVSVGYCVNSTENWPNLTYIQAVMYPDQEIEIQCPDSP